MVELLKIGIGTTVLLLGFPIGNFLAKATKEELNQGQKWFKMIIIANLIGAVISLIFRKDFLLFSFLFIAIVTSRSLNNKEKILKALQKILRTPAA